MSVMQPLDLRRQSANTATVPAPLGNTAEVSKLIDVSKCIGCKACQSACLEWNQRHEEIGYNHGVYDNPMDLTPESYTVMRYTEWDNPDGNLEWLIRKDGCMHCEDPGCLKACPSPGAIVQYSNGIVDFISEHCIGCGYCIKGCPFNIPRLSPVTEKVSKCTLCSDRVAYGQEPACAKACPTKAIVFGTKEEMIHHAEERITDLKSRGFENAGLYNPEGVGGTHVMYVLHHADQPQLYANLPKDPKIDPFVELWKGNLKLGGLFAIGAAAVVALVHHLVTGANRVQPEDEVKADELVKDKV